MEIVQCVGHLTCCELINVSLITLFFIQCIDVRDFSKRRLGIA
jgi:hypothetical protein